MSSTLTNYAINFDVIMFNEHSEKSLTEEHLLPERFV